MLTTPAILVIVLITVSLVLELIFGAMLIYIAYLEQNDNITSDKDPRNRSRSSVEADPSSKPQSSNEVYSSDNAANKNYEKLKMAGRIPERMSDCATVGILIIMLINILVCGIGIGLSEKQYSASWNNSTSN